MSDRKANSSLCCCFKGSDDNENGNDAIEPDKPRGCTDVPFLILYIIFCCVMILISAFAFVYGNPLRLMNGMDTFGNICGSANEQLDQLLNSGLDLTDKPYVFFFNLQDLEHSAKICVSQCPDVELKSFEDMQEYFTNTSRHFCRYDFNFTSDSKLDQKSLVNSDIYNELCPKLPIYPSLPIMKRCIPNPLSDVNPRFTPAFSIFQHLNNLNIFKQILGDLAMTWKIVLGLTAVSFVISFLLVLMMHWMTAIFSYVILILSCLLSIGLTVFLWLTYNELKTVLDETPEDRLLEEAVKNERAFLTYSIISTIISVVLVIIAIYLRGRVAIIVQLFREAGKALWEMPCLLIQPFITYIALTVFFLFWLLVVLCLATADIPTSRNLFENKEIAGDDPGGNGTLEIAPKPGMTLIEYKEGAWIKYFWFVYVIGLVWCSEFILACQQMVIATSVSTWYFSRKRSALKCVVFESCWRLVKYHMGSMALGSLIITIVKVPRLILTFMQRVLRKWEDNKAMEFCMKCCICCLRCLEGTLQYIHHNAYTVIAIQGVNFCNASRLAFGALAANGLQISLINSIGDFVLFLAKCITAALTGLIALFVFKSDDRLYFYAIPVFLVVLFAYFVAHCVISVFEMTVDTLFLCFCEDFNMNAETDGSKIYAPMTLYKFLTEDAVDAIAPGRRENSVAPKKKVKNADMVGGDLDEIIPMNTTESKMP